MAKVGPLNLTTVIYWFDNLHQALAGGKIIQVGSCGNIWLSLFDTLQRVVLQ